MEEKKEIKQGADLRLRYHPLKDTIVILIALVIFALLLTLSFTLRPQKKNAFVEIKYLTTLLYEKDDPNKATEIAFPKNGEKKVTFRKEDSALYLPVGEEFAFQGDMVTITLFSDESIAILQEDITCPDHVCSHMGRVYATYTPIVCLPNGIQAMIVSGKSKPSTGGWDNG